MIRNYVNSPITKRFIDAFPQFKRTDPLDTTNYFWEAWNLSPFYDSTFSESDMSDIYNHLLADYYNWHFIYMDDLGITLNVFKTVNEYYPNVKERLNIVKQIREMTIEEFSKSGINIDSSGANPKTATEMDELIGLVDSQNASFQLKSKEQTLKAKYFSLYDGIFDDFIVRFKPLFVKLYNGVNDYLYENPIEEG